MSASSPRALIISSDGHAGARMADYRDYLDPTFREPFDRFLAGYDAMLASSGRLADVTPRVLTFDPPHTAVQPHLLEEHVREVLDSGAVEGEHDPHRRLELMESVGVVAEVLYPNSLPFSLVGGFVSIGEEPELKAGARAFNRWLADFCSAAPDRFAGLGIVPFYAEPDTVIAELHAIKDAGLRGIVLPGIENTRPAYITPAYDRVWATCVDLELSVNVHGATGVPAMTCLQDVDPATGLIIFAAELSWYAHRPLWFLTFGGVFERHPGLEVVFSEQLSGWVPPILERLDFMWSSSRHVTSDRCRLAPSEYFARQCYLGASLASKAELAVRHRIGVDKLMYGVDLPHLETSWYRNLDYLRVLLGGNDVPAEEARKFLGETAAGVYGFDLAKLGALADQFGPPMADLLEPTPPGFAERVDRVDLLRPALAT